jgi:sortase A
MHKVARIFGTLLIAAGLLTLTWVVLVWRWEDPFTAAYTHFQQSKLSSAYDKRAEAFRPRLSHGDLAATEKAVAADASAYRRTLKTGDAIGRIRIGRIGLKMVVVQGTDHDSLKKGPGHYAPSGLPGQGHLIYVAGHRTTYLAPFAEIDKIRAGDYIRFELPYATFTYRATRHYVVEATAVDALKDHNVEVLRLQACHPRFFATHRYLVDAKLVSVEPRGGTTYTPTRLASATRARSTRS